MRILIHYVLLIVQCTDSVAYTREKTKTLFVILYRNSVAFMYTAKESLAIR